jgi:uncharacterized protein
MTIPSKIPDILFLDTVFIVGLLNRRDPWHDTAVSLLPVIEQVPHTVTTEEDLTETGNALSCLHRSLATLLYQELLFDQRYGYYIRYPRVFSEWA